MLDQCVVLCPASSFHQMAVQTPDPRFCTGALKMTDMKLQDMKLADQVAVHEIAGHENDGPNSRA